jgi:hypothetical protein
MLEVIAIYRPLVRLLALPSVTTITSKLILCCVCATRQTYLLFNNGTVLQYSTVQGNLGNNKTQQGWLALQAPNPSSWGEGRGGIPRLPWAAEVLSSAS